jgi:hypothetical protein
MADHARKLPPFNRGVLLMMSTPVCLKEEATQRVDRLKDSLALGHDGQQAIPIPQIVLTLQYLKETHTFKGDRPANSSRVKAISSQMKDHLCQNFICTSSSERGCLGSCRTGHQANIEKRWLVGHRTTLSGVSDHTGLCGCELWVLKVAGTASFFPSFHIAGHSTELRNVGPCVRCACLDVLNSIVSYGGHPARNFVNSTRFLLPCSCNHLLSCYELSPRSRPHNSDWT